MVITWVMKIFLYSSSVYSCHFFLVSSASVRSTPFPSLIVPIFAWNVPFVSLISLKRFLVFTIQLFSSISLYWSLMKAFLSLCGILWNSAFRWLYLPFSSLPFPSLPFIAICKASSDNHFAFYAFLFLGDAFDHHTCTVLWTSIDSYSGTLFIRSNPLIYLLLPLYNQKGFNLGHTWVA